MAVAIALLFMSVAGCRVNWTYLSADFTGPKISTVDPLTVASDGCYYVYAGGWRLKRDSGFVEISGIPAGHSLSIRTEAWWNYSYLDVTVNDGAEPLRFVVYETPTVAALDGSVFEQQDNTIQITCSGADDLLLYLVTVSGLTSL